ncbi:MAG: hypothetical protein AB1714_25560 [Acidobacteriota bacterium]
MSRRGSFSLIRPGVTKWCIVVAAVGVLLIDTPIDRRCYASDTILEQYRFLLGQSADGVTLKLHDQSFGGGTARCSLSICGRKSGVSLQMRVRRAVRPDEIVLALLVFSVEVRGYDSGGRLSYSHELGGFTFGDSRPGAWHADLDSLPRGLREIEVVFLGNYE